jgi:hypothetical protein
MQPEERERIAAEHIGTAVARGRDACATIVANTVDYLDGEGQPEFLQAMAWRLVGPAFAAHLDAQASWPARTDNDRLSDAFRALDASGIVAREDFTCCQNCGVNEIGDEVGEAASPRGYVFYHAQDAERAAGGGSIYLSYGLFGQPTTVEFAEEVTEALRAQGLGVDWEGSLDKRIHVRLDWARRRHGRMAEFATPHPAEPVAEVEVVSGRHRVAVPMPLSALARLELPFLPTGVSVRVNGSAALHRDHHRLVSEDGRSVGRFDGQRLLQGGSDDSPEAEPGLLEVTFESGTTGPSQGASRPMVLAETLDVLRRLPTWRGSWLCAVSPTGGIVQMRWEHGHLWLETPNPSDATSTGKVASLDEAELMLTILATEDRVAITELDGVTTKPW